MRLKSVGGLIATIALAGLGGAALAEPIELEFSAGVSTLLIDRGESLATTNNEFGLTISHQTSIGGVYTSLYRITPIGGDARAFDEEVDFTIGIGGAIADVGYDLSANYLTLPGSAEEASLELAAEFVWDHSLQPGIAAFYDVDLDVHGAEAFIAPERGFGDWTGTLILRGGFVGSDQADYSYAGLELAFGRGLNEVLNVEGFVCVEAADEDTFASRVESGSVTEVSGDGAGLGLRFVARQ
jgi:hypothetical protein